MDNIDRAMESVLLRGVVTIHRAMIDVAGDITAALMLEEIYASLLNTEENSLIYNREDWSDMFGIDKGSQINAENRLISDGFINIAYVDGTNLYSCNKDVLIDALAKLALPDSD